MVATVGLAGAVAVAVVVSLGAVAGDVGVAVASRIDPVAVGWGWAGSEFAAARLAIVGDGQPGSAANKATRTSGRGVTQWA